MTELDHNKAIVRQLLEQGFNNNDLTQWDELTSPEVEMRSSPTAPPADRDAWTQNVSALHQAFPDIAVTIEDMVAEGDTVTVLETIRGTQAGEFLGFAATDQSVTIHACAIFQIRGGRIVAVTTVADMLGLLAQLGHVSLPS